MATRQPYGPCPGRASLSNWQCDVSSLKEHSGRFRGTGYGTACSRICRSLVFRAISDAAHFPFTRPNSSPLASVVSAIPAVLRGIVEDRLHPTKRGLGLFDMAATCRCVGCELILCCWLPCAGDRVGRSFAADRVVRWQSRQTPPSAGRLPWRGSRNSYARYGSGR
jgi:hypothetical protein